MLFLLLLVPTAITTAQDNTTTRRSQRNSNNAPTEQPQIPDIRDSLRTSAQDSALVRDTIPRPGGPIDTAITYYARDSVRYFIRERKLRLVGNARVTYHDQQLEAEVIEIYFDSSTMIATSGRDSTGRITGVPKFTDKDDSFYGERLVYNFKTRRGTITLGETVADDGFYFGERIKRVDENTLFIENGCFTTCDLPHPHYYFKSPTMKVVANDRIFVDPLIMYVEDLPVFIYPFGLFLENKTGRRSGLIIPSFFFSGAPGSLNRGIVFQDLGYFWAVNDYFDTRFLADITTKGGFTLKNNSRLVVRDELNSSVDLAYGRVRYSTEEEFTQSWNLSLQHNHTISPYTRVNANVRFASQDFNRRTSSNLAERIQQNIFSSASFQHTFDNGGSLSLTYSRDQNIITNALTEVLPVATYSLPQVFFLRSFVNRDSWLSDVSFSYSVSGNRTERRPASTDTLNQRDVSTKITHNPSLNIAPKLGYFTISPQVSYNESWFFRRLTLTPNLADSSLTKSYEKGFFRSYEYDFRLSVSTRMYGIIQPGILGVNALRHTFSPQISYLYRPDFSTPNYDFYKTYIDPTTGLEQKYSVFQSDGGAVSAQLQQSIGFNFGNNIEAKIAAPIDTMPDVAVQLINFDIGGNYNFAADSLRWSEISLNARTSAGGMLSLNGGASFNLYDQTLDTLGRYVTINNLLASQGKGLARLTRASLSLQTSFSSTGLSASPSEIQPGVPTNDSIDYGARFRQRLDTTYVRNDLYGDSSPGYSPLSIPWNISLFFTIGYSESSPISISRSASLGASFNFNLTQSWSVNSSFTYDFINKNINIPQVTITKNLHCWRFDLNWVPTGASQGFYMRLSVESPTLSDVKIEKRENAIYN